MNSKVNSIQVQVGLSSPLDIGVTFLRKPDFRADGIPNNASYWTYDWHIDVGHRSADFRERRYLRAVSAQRALMARMTAPAPLPVDDSMSMHFVNGEVDYIEPGALIDNDMDELPY